MTTSHSPLPHPPRDQHGRDLVDTHAAAAELVRLAIQASRTAPRGTRPEWLRQLETDLGRAEPGRVTLDRLLALLFGAAACGASLDGLGDAMASVIRGASGPSAAPSLKLALLEETTAESAVNPCEARVIAGVADTADEVAALDGLRHQARATGVAMEALERALYGPRRAA